jgi:cell wall assembly regulator SMI1
MKSIWQRIQAALSTAPLSLRLRPGTTEAAVRAAERTIGMPFPDDFRASLLVHDGQDSPDDDRDIIDWLPGHAPLAPLDAIVEEWKNTCACFEKFHGAEEPEPLGDGHYHFLWHPKRIPIAGNPWFDQDNTYLDFFPGPNGTPGQLAMFGKGCFGEVHGPSFGAALELYARGLESGEWLFRDGEIHARAKRMNWPKYVTKKLARAAR